MDIYTKSMYWVLAGVLGWAIMCCYRIVTDGLPKEIPLYAYVGGFVMSCVLGPLTITLIGCILIYERYNE